jgi:hypothetical protein
VKKAAIKAAMNAEQDPSLILLGKKTFEELSRQEDARKAVTATIGNIIIEMMHVNRIPGMVAYMRPFSVPATAGTLASTYVREGMVYL